MKSEGFTLAELLVVVAIIVLMANFLFADGHVKAINQDQALLNIRNRDYKLP